MKDWLSQFIVSFGSDDSSSYHYQDQREVFKNYNNEKGNTPANQERTNQNDATNQENAEESGINEDGEEIEVKVKSLSKKLNKDKEDEWMDREMTVTFTSLDNKDKIIHSNIEYLCGGRYANLKHLSAGEVAKFFIKEYDKVFKYADASIANYSDMIDARQALRLAKSVSEKSIISHVDYDKLCSKLNNKNLIKEFDSLLGEVKIRVAYPIVGMKKESSTPVENYYINYIRDFKEYKTRDMVALKARVASFANQLSKEDVDGLLKEVVKDEVLKNIFQ
jgi:hypothetical protein